VFATGFQAHNYMRPMNLRGRDGVSIDDARAKGPRAYRMTAIPGFPNFFTVLGPTHRRDPFRCSTPRSWPLAISRSGCSDFATERSTPSKSRRKQRRSSTTTSPPPSDPQCVEHRLQFLVPHRWRQRRSVALWPQGYARNARWARRWRLPRHASRCARECTGRAERRGGVQHAARIRDCG